MPTPTEYANAVSEAQGLISVAARRLGVDRSAIYQAAKTLKSSRPLRTPANELQTLLKENCSRRLMRAITPPSFFT